MQAHSIHQCINDLIKKVADTRHMSCMTLHMQRWLQARLDGTDALDLVALVPGELVVVGDLSASRDVCPGIDAHAQIPVHQPLLRRAVGLAGVVDEASMAALQCCIYHLIGPAWAEARLSVSLASALAIGSSTVDRPRMMVDKRARS